MHKSQSEKISLRPQRHFILKFATMILLALISILQATSLAQAVEQNRSDAEVADATSYLIEVRLPLVGDADETLIEEIESVIDKAKGRQPIVVLQFVDGTKSIGRNNKIGSDTDFSRALSVSRFLLSLTGNRARTIAFIDRDLIGHACLIALSCKEIAIGEEIEFGQASISSAQIDPIMQSAYENAAVQRNNFPASAVNSMLDRESGLVRVTKLGEKQIFVSKSKSDELKSDGEVRDIQTLVRVGELANFTGRELRAFRWAQHLVDDLQQLQSVIEVPGFATLNRTKIEGLNVGLVELRGFLSSIKANRTIRAMEELIGEGKNCILLDIDCDGGTFIDSLRLAQWIANLNENVTTVAFTRSNLAAPVAIVATSADECYLNKSASLGGPSVNELSEDEILQFESAFNELANSTGRDPSQFIALSSSTSVVSKYRNARRQTRWEIDSSFDADGWIKIDSAPNNLPVKAAWLANENWIDGTAETLAAVAIKKGINVESIPEPRRESAVEGMVRQIAETPWLPSFLLFIAFVAFMNELSAPGIGIAGLVSVICIVLFFWISFLSGTVEWLEILLFVGGVIALAIELFAIPGFGIFGISGLVMMIVSLVLASQTFIVPSNTIEMEQLTWNVWRPTFAVLGIFIGLFLIRNHLENLPLFRMFALKKLTDEEAAEISAREYLANYDSLLGKSGQTVTRCNPAGKANIDGQLIDVLSDGALLHSSTNVKVIEVSGNKVVVSEIVAT